MKIGSPKLALEKPKQALDSVSYPKQKAPPIEQGLEMLL
jgi:hypothetical protein